MADRKNYGGAVLWWGIDLDTWRQPWGDEDWDGCYNRKRGIKGGAEAAKSASGCVIRGFGFKVEYASPMHGALVLESMSEAPPEEPVRLAGLAVREPWRERLQRFMEILELPWQEPGWHLSSYFLAC